MSDVDDELRIRAEARVGTVLRGKYAVERVIGIGGMASVYEALHRNGRRVALKLLHPELSIRTDLRKRFLREAQAANAVKHTAVVAVLDDDVTEDGAAFLVMELLEGQNVEELWEAHGRKLPTKAVLTIASDLCAVLAVAHSAGVIHRDLKPANLFVTDSSELKILDFGIARVRDAAASSATSTGSVFGTPAFMAPEQAGGLVNELGPHTDIWAVGATMFTLLSGRSVHEGQSGQHIAILAATKPAPSLADVMPEAPPEVVSVVDRALAFDKAHRWSSAAEMQTALSEAMTRLTEQELTDDVTIERGTLSETMLAHAGAKAERTGTLASRGNEAFLGGTTGQPVSSTPITEVDQTIRTPSAWERGRAAFYRWWSQRRKNADVLVSSDAPTRRRSSSKGRLFGVVAAIVIAVIVGTSVFVTAGHRAARSTPEASSGPPVLDETSPPAVPAEPMSTSAATPAPSTSPPIPRDEPHPSVSSTVRTVKAPPTRPRTATPSTPPRLNCNPPFIIQDGIQIHKTGCP